MFRCESSVVMSHRQAGWVRIRPMRVGLMRIMAFWLLILGAAGCEVAIARDLGDSEANRAMVALAASNIAANKQPDVQAEGRFQLSVSQGDVALAIASLHSAGLPSEARPGVLQALGDTGLIASRGTEQARLIAGTAGDLERSLRDVDGVLGVRVHLAVPEADPFSQEETRQTATASVLLRHRGTTPPISDQDVRRLVAGAVSGLDAERVAVVLHPVTARSVDADNSLSRLGPIAVTRSSASSLKVVLLAAGLLNVLLVGLVIVLLTRVRRIRSSAAAEGAT